MLILGRGRATYASKFMVRLISVSRLVETICDDVMAIYWCQMWIPNIGVEMCIYLTYTIQSTSWPQIHFPRPNTIGEI